MVTKLELAAIPNQSISISLDGGFFDLTIKETHGVMSADVTLDNVVLIQGVRIVPGRLLIPYKYLTSGNFFIETENDEYPDYRKFGITQFLLYGSQADIEAV